VLLVDWTVLGKHVQALVVAVPVAGRAVTICATTLAWPSGTHGMRRAEQATLQRLRAILPVGTRPIFIGDAGFKARFVRDICDRGWDVLVRVRGQPNVLLDAQWQAPPRVHRGGTRVAQDLGTSRLAKNGRVTPVRLGLGPLPKRQRNRRPRDPPRRSAAACGNAAKAAKEPWLRATSIHDLAPAQLVARDARRMQI